MNIDVMSRKSQVKPLVTEDATGRDKSCFFLVCCIALIITSCNKQEVEITLPNPETCHTHAPKWSMLRTLVNF